MKQKSLFLLALASMVSLWSVAQDVVLDNAKFHEGDDPTWASVGIDDASWRDIKSSATWTSQGIKIENGYGWYRFHVNILRSMLEKSDLKETVDFILGGVDDADETYLNGKLIGKTGRFPGDANGYQSQWNVKRCYRVPASSSLIKWDGVNVLAVRVYNGGDPGGMFEGPVRVRVPNTIDNLSISIKEDASAKEGVRSLCTLKSTMKATKSGTFAVKVVDPETDQVLSEKAMKVSVNQKKDRVVSVPYDNHRMVRIEASFTEGKT